jgi:hypothetical protein
LSFHPDQKLFSSEKKIFGLDEVVFFWSAKVLAKLQEFHTLPFLKIKTVCLLDVIPCRDAQL